MIGNNYLPYILYTKDRFTAHQMIKTLSFG